MTSSELDFLMERHTEKYSGATEMIRELLIKTRKAAAEKRLEGLRDHELKFLFMAKRLGFPEADEAIKAQLERMKRSMGLGTGEKTGDGGMGALELK